MVENAPDVIGCSIQPAYGIEPPQGDVLINEAARCLNQRRLPVAMTLAAKTFSQIVGFRNSIVLRCTGSHRLREVMQLPRQIAQAGLAA